MNHLPTKSYMFWVHWIFVPLLFISIQGILIYSRTKPYGFQMSSLIGIEQQMAELNPSYIDSGTIIFTKDGYDGEFFYFFSKYFFDSKHHPFPVIDSVYFRFHRIGMPILTGAFSRILSWEFYPWIVVGLYNIFFVLSYFLFLKLLIHDEPWLPIFYLFSPFFMTGELLLVSDPLALGWGGIGVAYFYLARYNPQYLKNYLLSAGMLLGCMFIRETGIWLALGIGGMGYFLTRGRAIFSIGPLGILYGACIGLYLGFFLGVRFYPFPEIGINPNGFTQVLDYPLAGAIKSIQSNPKITGIMIQVWMLMMLLILSWIVLYQIHKDLRTIPLRIAILGILSPAYLGDSSYWDTFDNLSRMFTLVSPLLLAWRLETIALSRIRIYFWMNIILLILLIIRAFAITPPRTFQTAPLVPKYELGELDIRERDCPSLLRIG
jgi:hypothetical protein